MFRRGEVVLARYPFTDLSAAKARPALIVSGETYHRHRSELILAALTSNLSSATGDLDYILQDWAAAGLKLPTAFKPILATLHLDLIVHRIGTLIERDLVEVENRLRLMLDLL